MKRAEGNVQQRMSLRRAVCTGALCLILGAVITVVVAWGCVWNARAFHHSSWYPPLDRPPDLTPRLAQDLSQHAGPDWPDIETGVWTTCKTTDFGFARFGYTLVSPDRFAISGGSGSSPFHVAHSLGGWPMHALRCTDLLEVTQFGWGRKYLSDAFMIEVYVDYGNVAMSGHMHRPFPLRPIFPGFLINTFFYGAIWFGLFLGLSAARKTVRRRRGRCPMCGYDLRGDLARGCSECGWNRES